MLGASSWLCFWLERNCCSFPPNGKWNLVFKNGKKVGAESPHSMKGQLYYPKHQKQLGLVLTSRRTLARLRCQQALSYPRGPSVIDSCWGSTRRRDRWDEDRCQPSKESSGRFVLERTERSKPRAAIHLARDSWGHVKFGQRRYRIHNWHVFFPDTSVLQWSYPIHFLYIFDFHFVQPQVNSLFTSGANLLSLIYFQKLHFS